MDNRKISIAIPTWNRGDVLIESFSKVIGDERVENIHIQDDASDIGIYNQVKSIIEVLNQTHGNKITYSRNLSNQDCFRNKYHSVLGAKSEWLVLLDSDNVIDVDYLDRLYEIDQWDEQTIYTPEFARTHFDFRAYSGLTISKENVSEYIDKPMFEVALNAANYFINKDEWIKCWISEPDPVTSDSIFVCMNWLVARNKIKFVSGLQYNHKVWENSHYQNNVSRTPAGFHESILNTLRKIS